MFEGETVGVLLDSLVRRTISRATLTSTCTDRLLEAAEIAEERS
jgi:hypothetical protein